MGQTSSQVAPTSVQTTKVADLLADSSPPRTMDGAEDKIMYEHEEEAAVGKKRKAKPGHEGEVTNKSKKRKNATELKNHASNLEDFMHGKVAPGEAMSDAVAKAKKSKKLREKTAQSGRHVEEFDVTSTQPISETVAAIAVAPTQHEQTQAQDEAVEPAKSKRRKPTGRRSGLKFAPATSPEPTEQATDAMQGAKQSANERTNVTENEQPEIFSGAGLKAVAGSIKRKRVSADDFQYKKRTKPAPDDAARTENDGDIQVIPDSQPREEAAQKKPNAKNQKAQRRDRDSSNVVDEYASNKVLQVPSLKDIEDDAQKQIPVKAKRKRKDRSKQDATDDADLLPTPRATQAVQAPSDAIGHEIMNAPTPPTSVHGSGGLREDYEVFDATNEVADWLDDQNVGNEAQAPAEKTKKKRKRVSQPREDSETTPKPEQVEQASGQDGRSPRQRRRKAKDNTQPLHEEADNPAAQDTTVAQANEGRGKIRNRSARADEDFVYTAGKKHNSSKKSSRTKDKDEDQAGVPNATGRTVDNGRPAKNDPAKGPFTDAEKRLVDKIYSQLHEESGKTENEYRASLMNWKEATEFKSAVHDALPRRPIAAIRKFCQRRYHNLERGPWTEEQDQTLRNAQGTNPDKWTEISALVGRTAADCKDRWVQHLSLADNKQVGPWSQEEEAALSKAVEECVAILKKENREDKSLVKDRSSLESMISWKTVAQKVGGQRSAKRCNEKWHKMKKRDANTNPVQDSTVSTGLDPDSRSRKMRDIEKKYNQCDVGDLYDILTEIHTAIPNHSHNYDHESSLWARVATANPGSRFKSVMRRRGFYDASDVYKSDVKLKGTIAASAKALADYLVAQWGLEALKAKRAFLPKDYITAEADLDAPTSTPHILSSGKASKKSVKEHHSSASQMVKSAAHVADSSEDEDDSPTPTPKKAKSSKSQSVSKSAKKATKAKKSAKSTERVDNSDEEDS